MRLETIKELRRHIKAIELALLREIEYQESKVHKAAGAAEGKNGRSQASSAPVHDGPMEASCAGNSLAGRR